MFKAIFMALRLGNPTTWTISALTAIMLAMSLFGAGFYTAVRVQSHANAIAIVQAAKAQEKQDIQQHQVATAVSQNARQADVKHDTKTVTLIKTIHEPGAAASCDLPADVADALNKAAQF